MRARLHPTVVLRPEDFGGISYAPSRDDFFALDDATYAFLRAFARDRWLDIPDESTNAVTRLAGLELLDTTPPTSPESYSGPSFIGFFKDIVTLGEPLVLNCFSTAHCPLRCVYCHADDLMTAERRHIEVAAHDLRLENVATTARSIDSVVAVITGGDPFTRPERARFLISKLSGHKSLVLDTSGVAERGVVDSLIPFLRDHRVHVRVSLDSPDARVQRKIRPTNRAYASGLNSYDSALYTIRACLAEGVPTTIQTVVSKHTDTSEVLFPLRDFLLELGVRHWVLHMAVEAGAARRMQSRAKGGRGGILPQPSAGANIWRVVKSTMEERFPIDIRVTDNGNTPNSVLLLGSDGVLYTEGLAHRGKVALFDPESGRPDRLRKLFYYIDKFGHARRYLNWNPEMFEGQNLEDLCIKLPLGSRRERPEQILVEQERKYRVQDLTSLLESLSACGYESVNDVVVDDRYFDTDEGALTQNDFVLRVRLQEGRVFFAEKGPRFRRASGEYDRIELELPLREPDELLSALGERFIVSWQLVRRRQSFARGEDWPTIVIDHLAELGGFLEIEGRTSAVEAVLAGLAGLGAQETRNYSELVLDWARERGHDSSRVFGLGPSGLLLRTH